MAENILRKRKLPLWEAKWNREELLKKKAALTHQAFERGFRQRPFSEEDRLFSLAKIAEATDRSLSVDDVKAMNGPVFTGVDLSSTKRPGVSFFTFKAVRDGSRYIRFPVDIRVGEFKGQAFVDQFMEIEREWKPQVYAVENNAVQERVIDLLSITAVGNLPVWGYYTGKQKVDEMIGLPSLSTEFQNDLWRIPWRGRGRSDNPPDGHGMTCGCGWCQWYYDEIQVYPMAETTDILMGMWFAREGLRQLMPDFEVFELIEHPKVPGQFNW